MNSLSSQIIVDIINKQLSMPADSVWLRDQNRLIPNDTALYISVGLVNSPNIMASTTRLESRVLQNWDEPGAIWDQENNRWDLNATFEVNELVVKEMVQVDLFSRSNDAIMRNWEVIAAMQSIYAQQKMELNNFRIFRPLNMINTSGAEGGSQLNRYTISIPCMVWYRKEIPQLPPGDYYDDFHQRVDDKNTIGTDKPLIEFEINSEGIV